MKNNQYAKGLMAVAVLVAVSAVGFTVAFGYGGSSGGAGQINQFAYTPVPTASAVPTPVVTASPSVSPTPVRTPVVIRRTPSVSPAPVSSNGVSASSTPAPSTSTSVSPSPSTVGSNGQATLGNQGGIFSAIWHWIKNIF